MKMTEDMIRDLGNSMVILMRIINMAPGTHSPQFYKFKGMERALNDLKIPYNIRYNNDTTMMEIEIDGVIFSVEE